MEENVNNTSEKVTDQNIRLIMGKYFTPTIEESSKGIVLRYVPNFNGPEAIVWFDKAKRGYTRKPISRNEWVMVDCDLRPLHELLHKHFHLSEGDFNVTRTTLSLLSYDIIREHFSPKTL